MTRWDEVQYLMFAEERTRPARELLARVAVEKPHLVVDLGCGPGNSTELLAERWPFARVVGVDNSPEMLARARAELPDVTFLEADVARYRPEQPVDLLFANAVFQWLPEHDELLPELMAALTPGGALAFQVPNNFHEPSHHAMRELPGPWAERVSKLRREPSVSTPAHYYDLLAPHAQHLDIWQTTYEHVMDDAQAIVEWVKGTGLRPYLDLLDETERTAYLDAYTKAIDAAYPTRIDGKKLFSFPRLFVVAVR
jgi:trans-aconitate 2-methyltransferase